MEPAPIGFEMQNDRGGATVTPAPMPQPEVIPAPPTEPQEPALYPPINPPEEERNGYQAYSNPIGFEMQERNHDDGPTEVVSEKIPIEIKGETPVNIEDKNEEEDHKDEDTIFFEDGVRKIDYVLAYEPEKTGSNENRRLKREYFEKELQSEGLQLEYEPIERSKSGKVAFVKVHAPWEVLAKHAELMNMKMPLHPNDMELELRSIFDCIPTPFDLDEDLLEEDDNYFTAPFNRSRMDHGQ